MWRTVDIYVEGQGELLQGSNKTPRVTTASPPRSLRCEIKRASGRDKGHLSVESRHDSGADSILPIVQTDGRHTVELTLSDRCGKPLMTLSRLSRSHSSAPVLAAFEPRLAPLEERRHALLVIFGQARQRELVDVHVACEIVERVRQAIDGELGHGDRQRRLLPGFCGQRPRGGERPAANGALLHQPPLVSV